MDGVLADFDCGIIELCGMRSKENRRTILMRRICLLLLLCICLMVCPVMAEENSEAIPGVQIGDGAIIGANSVVGSNVDPYTIVVGNPARVLRKRFDDELIDLMLRFRWWDKSIEEIDSLIPILTCSDLEKVRAELKARL